MFSVPTKNKTALFATFSLPRAPKSSQNIGFYDVFATTKNASVAKTPLFATLWQHNMSEMLYFTHARNTVNTNEFKDYIFHGNKPQTAKTLLFTAFLRNDFSKNTFFFDNFWLLKPPKTKRGGTPPPFYILNFKIFTKSKTFQFLELKTRPEPHFLTVFTMFYARA